MAKKTAPKPCSCHLCVASPGSARRPVEILVGRLSKHTDEHDLHRLNVHAGRVARHLAAVGSSMKKHELEEAAERYMSAREGYDRILARGTEKDVRTWKLVPTHRESRWMLEAVTQARANAQKAFGPRQRADALQHLRQLGVHFCHYGPTGGRWPGEEYHEDRAARIAALELARRIEEYLARGGGDGLCDNKSSYAQYNHVTEGMDRYVESRRKALRDMPPGTISHSLFNASSEQLAAFMRRLRGPARVEMLYPHKQPGLMTFAIRYAAESPLYRYPAADVVAGVYDQVPNSESALAG
jgi:hypothetical protein